MARNGLLIVYPFDVTIEVDSVYPFVCDSMFVCPDRELSHLLTDSAMCCFAVH